MTAIEVERYDDADGRRWNELVERSIGDVFHRYEFLTVLDDHSLGELVPLIAHENGTPIGVCPAFEVRKGPVAGVLSPPPGVGVSRLGPAAIAPACDAGSDADRSTVDRSNERFVRACLEGIRRISGPVYVQMQTPTGYEDVRPFQRAGFEATPLFTYVVDLGEDPDALLSRFSRDARRNAQSTPDGVEVREEGPAAARRIISQVRDRYERQGQRFPVTNSFVTDLYEGLPEGCFRPYVCRRDGEFVGGILVLDDGDTVYRWQGGVATASEVGFPVNDLLDWHVMAEAIERGVGAYDLVGANTRRIAEYKSKFDPRLDRYYRLERAPAVMKWSIRAYDRARTITPAAWIS